VKEKEKCRGYLLSSQGRKERRGEGRFDVLDSSKGGEEKKRGRKQVGVRRMGEGRRGKKGREFFGKNAGSPSPEVKRGRKRKTSTGNRMRKRKYADVSRIRYLQKAAGETFRRGRTLDAKSWRREKKGKNPNSPLPRSGGKGGKKGKAPKKETTDVSDPFRGKKKRKKTGGQANWGRGTVPIGCRKKKGRGSSEEGGGGFTNSREWRGEKRGGEIRRSNPREGEKRDDPSTFKEHRKKKKKQVKRRQPPQLIKCAWGEEKEGGRRLGLKER